VPAPGGTTATVPAPGGTTTTASGRSASSAPLAGACLPSSAAGTTAAEGDAIDPPVAFQASPLTATRNLGADRESENVVFKLTTDKPLGKDVEKRLELVADPIVRVGETTDSASFPEPTFSALRVSRNRKTLSFRVCLDPDNDLPAGKYVGTISLEGPPGVDSSTMTITANAKDGGVFWASSILSLVLAFFVLLYKASKEERTRRTADVEKRMPTPQGELPTSEKETALKNANKYPSAAWASFKDFGWLFPTFFALGGAFGALWGIYVANPAWGEAGPLTSGLAVIGAGLAAIGAKTILTDAK
jgi:hypothetical protein